MKSILEYLPTNYWIMKSEPNVFSLSNLIEKKTEFWDGVRNYLARNFMTQHMKVGDKVLFYHSNANPTGIAGTCEVVEAAKPDLSALNSNSNFYDPKSTFENPRWFGVTVGNPQAFKHFISLSDLRKHDFLENMLLLRKGQRLSILPLSKEEYDTILKMGGSNE